MKIIHVLGLSSVYTCTTSIFSLYYSSIFQFDCDGNSVYKTMTDAVPWTQPVHVLSSKCEMSWSRKKTCEDEAQTQTWQAPDYKML